MLCSSLPAGGGGDFHAFAEAAKDFNLIPFCRTIFFNEDTSTKVYLRLTKEDEGPYSPSFISTLPSSKGRYTLIGAQPAVEFVAKEKFVTVIDGWEGSRRDDIVEDPMRLLKRMMEKWKPQPLVGLPDTFCGGWFGYFSYDTFRYVEKKLSFSSAPKDDRFLPDIDVCLYDDVIVFDHLERKTYLIHWVLLDRYDSLEAAFFRGKLAESRLDSLFLKLPDGILPGALDSYIFDTSSLRSNMTKEEYSLAVVKAKNNIGVGDHVVLSRRFYRRIDTDPFTVYRQLWSEPFGTYLKGRGYALISKSQENLVFVKQDTRELSERLSCWDALQVALPSAVVCGAPKAKAMELIDQLEQSRRGPYGGGVGFVSFFGDMDMSVSSDMILFPTGTGVAHIQVGIPVIR